jgi:predicted nucleic acid-binding protein
MSGLRAAANRPGHPFTSDDIVAALLSAEALQISMEATPWADVQRARTLSGSLRYADAVCMATAERHDTVLITADGRIESAGAPVRCAIITVRPVRDVPEA